MLVRVMYGARISLTVAFVASLVNLLIGVLYGSIAAYEGGSVDNVMMRIVDLINSIPLILYIILIRVVLDSTGVGTMILALASVYWVVMARLVRGQVLSLKEQEFVLAAQALGVPRSQIIVKHLIPNAIGPIIVSMTMMIPSAVFTEAFISFIGLGVSAPQASWGTLANDALQNLLSYPYQLFYPALAIALTMLSFNMLGDGLRDALDPRLRKG
jgi:oligopeptide transport system permease protein